MAFLGFCKIAEAKGDSKRKGHEDEFELLRFEHKVTQPVTLSGSGRGALTVSQSNHGEFYLVKEQDPASAPLLKFASNGFHIPEVKVTLCRQAGDQVIDYMLYEFKDCIVASFESMGDITGDGLPEEKVGIAYAQIKVTHTASDSTGKPLGKTTAEYKRTTGESA
ncbi:MAG TPA: type VI secretion system tube protein Hcp [Gammaproteobacteria bacterium]|jgi:type VI secretion system secreted protein Hcp|nr:type VI secretion system tube protein Hcp [Gammaproteobacteria bacterium]